MPEEFNCQECGICCLSDIPASGGHASNYYAEVTDADLERLPEAYQRYVCSPDLHGHFYQGLRVNKSHPDGPACIALKGRVLVDCRCDVYEGRPKVCRDFTPGSQHCKNAIATFYRDHAPGGLPMTRGGTMATKPNEWKVG
jgi:Fe-S-cluster containining protein